MKKTDKQQETLWSSLRLVSRELYSLDETPLFGTADPFPFEEFSQKISKALGLDSLTISSGEMVWREAKEIISELPSPHKSFHFQASGLHGNFAIVFSEQDIIPIMNAVLKIDLTAHSIPKEFQDAFFHFLSIELLSNFNSLNYEEKPSMKLLTTKELSNEPAFTIDVWVHIRDDRFLVRVVLYDLFRKSWRNFSIQKHGSKPSSDILETIPQILHVEAGRSVFSLKEWLTVSVGDFVSLDHIFYDPKDSKSKAILTLNNRPLYSASLHEGSLEIIEISQNEEVFEAMIDDSKNDNDKPEETKEAANPAPIKNPATSKDPAPLKDPVQENPPADDPPAAKKQASEEQEEEAEVDPPKEETASNEEDDPFGDIADEDEENNNLPEEEMKETTVIEETIEEEMEVPEGAEQTKKKVTKQIVEEKKEEKAHEPPPKVEIQAIPLEPQLVAGKLSTKDIPVTLVVELAQLEISTQKLLELQPGNMLELTGHQDNMVYLVVNKKTVGRGELIKIGDTLGVRIIELGH